MRIMLKFISLIFILMIGASPTVAQQDNPLGVSFYGSFLHTTKVPNALFFFSDIEENDSFELRKAIRNHDIDILVLSSRGGSVWEGLNMAGIVFDKGLKTYIPEQGIGGPGDCASACSFIFFGGSSRIADGKLGVHQFYSGSAKLSAEIGKTQRNAQFTVSEIIGFLNEFSTPPFVFERMFQQQEMYYFNESELTDITRIQDPISKKEIDEISQFIRSFNVEVEKLIEKDLNPKENVVKLPPKLEAPAKPRVAPTTIITKTMPEEQIIKNVQIQLNRLNCGAGYADGVIGIKTRGALERYANSKGVRISEASLKDQNFLNELKRSNTRCKLRYRNLICPNPKPEIIRGHPYGLVKLVIYDFTTSTVSPKIADPKASQRVKIEYCITKDGDTECKTELFEKTVDWGDRWDHYSFTSRNITYQKVGAKPTKTVYGATRRDIPNVTYFYHSDSAYLDVYKKGPHGISVATYGNASYKTKKGHCYIK